MSREKPERRCRTCRHVKRRELYPTPTARRCTACWAIEAARRCAACGGPVPAGCGKSRGYCDDSECQAEARSKAGRAGGVRRRPGLTKRCPACLKTKPLTTKYWYVDKRDAAGWPVKLDGYCKPCKRADQAARYATDEKRKAAARARAAQQRAEIRERCARDPEFARAWRRQQAVWSTAQRAKRNSEAREALAMMRPEESHIPAQPLVDVIAAAVRRQGRTDKEVCRNIGIDVRTYTAWRSGERAYAQFDVADRVLCRLGLNWFDAYDEVLYPEAHARAAELFG